MRRRVTLSGYLIFSLLAIGILSRIFTNPAPFIIPLMVFGVIFLLYKYPPNRWGARRRQSVKHGANRHSDRQRRKANFRVIYGNKPGSEDEPPRYH